MDDIERLLANRQRRLRWTARVLFLGACAMTVGFYASGRSLITMSENELLTGYTILDAVVMGVATALFWCLYVESAEIARLTRLVSEIVGLEKRASLILESSESRRAERSKQAQARVPDEGVTPERIQRLVDKIDRVLDTEYGELLELVIDFFYKRALSELESASPDSNATAARKRRQSERPRD